LEAVNQEIIDKVVYNLTSSHPPIIYRYKSDFDKTIAIIRLVQAIDFKGMEYKFFNELNIRETQVLAGMLTVYNRSPELGDNKARFKLVFQDKEAKDEICSHFNMKSSMYINTCSSLRSKDIVTFDSINPKFIFPSLDDLWVKFVKI
jgi:hypothetical protein